MYLELKQGSKEQHLRQINQLILKVFEYTAQTEKFDREKLKEFVKKDEVWSTGTYTPRRSFYNKIENLFTFSRAERENIYKAIRHDMEFDQYIEDSDFVFEEHQLSDEQIEAVKELILYLYKNPFRNGSFVIQGEITGYRQFKDSLFEHNETCICPVCLTMQTDLEDYGEVDHYFPKKSYPALIFHPINLAVVCSECNGFLVKGEKDIFKKDKSETSNLTELYIPYLRYAEKEVGLGVRWAEEKDGKGKDEKTVKVRKMVMVPCVPDANGLIDKRIQNLDNLFDLSKRWTKRMNNIIKNELKNLQRRETVDGVKEWIHHRAEEKKEEAEENKTKLLEAATFEYLENDIDRSVMAEWRMRQDEKGLMSAFNANA